MFQTIGHLFWCLRSCCYLGVRVWLAEGSNAIVAAVASGRACEVRQWSLRVPRSFPFIIDGLTGRLRCRSRGTHLRAERCCPPMLPWHASAPVQTYHRVLLTTPKFDKNDKSKPRNPTVPPSQPAPPEPATRRTEPSDGAGTQTPPASASAASAASSKRAAPGLKGGPWSNAAPRSPASRSSASRSSASGAAPGPRLSKNNSKASGLKDSRPADSRGSGGRRLHRNSSSVPSPSSDDETLFLSSQSSSSQPPPKSPQTVSPPASSIPPMLVSAGGRSPQLPSAKHRRKGLTTAGDTRKARIGSEGGRIPRKDQSKRPLS